MIKERQRHKLSRDVHIMPGDMLICRIQDRKSNVEHKFTERIDRSIIVDTVITFDIDEPILGLVDGIGAIFGTESK